MKVEMQILSKSFNDEKFDNTIKELEDLGWEVHRKYGGKMPTYEGHGAVLSKNF